MSQLELAPISPGQRSGAPEVWGGAEYTCNRVQDGYFDQMELSGHAHRIDDYERFCSLGIRTFRFGLLWERHEREPSWRWADERLARLRALGMRPVASLLHHGSGPAHTSLVDPQFPEKLAGYATQVAERYPWIDAYTPVNEPHTTARFSGLYGVWYPHHRSHTSYLHALLNQLKGTVLSMRAIRRVNPGAELIQTDDVGDISGTEELRPMWELLNERQWLTFDLLAGRVDRDHRLFEYLLTHGITEREIFWFAENPCPPDVLGINYYVTSDRWLDHRVDLYPAGRGSAEGPVVDVEAVRVRPDGIVGVGHLLTKAWERYGIPVAITEVHLGAHVDEQIRWLADMWHGMRAAQRSGVDCKAFTVWALLGSFYWNQLVTCENGHYEPGVFDVRGGQPRATELAKVVAQIARGKDPRHPALSHAGWWKHDLRIQFPYAEDGAEEIAA